MKFHKSWPKESGYYWYVDTHYPIPKIGFLLQSVLYDGNKEYQAVLHAKFIRVGDMIPSPPCNENEIVD
jgi:hypothetical protein